MRMKTKATAHPLSPRASELTELRARLAEAEETLAAIRSGDVDALLLSPLEGDQVFTLQSADRPYRLLIEAMNEGALTVLADTTVLYCNRRFSEFVKTPIEQIIGGSLCRFIPEKQHAELKELLNQLPPAGGAQLSLALQTGGGPGETVPIQLSFRVMQLEKFTAIAVVATDLSERKRFEEFLRGQNAELEWRVSERTSELTRSNAALLQAQD